MSGVHQRSLQPSSRFACVAVLLTLLAGWAIAASAESPQTTQPSATQPSASHAPAFDPSQSDAKAIEIADAVLAAVGGQQGLDNTRFVTWNFFERRRTTWDRQTGDIRIESGQRTPGQDIGSVVLMNLNTRQGRAWAGGQEVLDETQLKTTLDAAYAIWENDSYWLFMPFKLKDGGVILKYRGEGTTKDGRAADILRVMFKDVGSTPWTMYDLWITRDDHLISQWAYFPNSGLQEPEFTQPWKGWRKHGEVLFSSDRGERDAKPARITDIAVFQSLPAGVFTSQAALDWRALIEQAAAKGG